MKNRNNRKHIFPILVLVAGVIAGVGAMLGTPTAVAEEIVVYKSPTCGCCKKWVAHMRENGFKVTVRGTCPRRCSETTARRKARCGRCGRTRHAHGLSGNKDPYDIIAFGKSGKSTIYASR